MKLEVEAFLASTHVKTEDSMTSNNNMDVRILRH